MSDLNQYEKCEHGIPRRFCTALHKDDPGNKEPLELPVQPDPRCEGCDE